VKDNAAGRDACGSGHDRRLPNPYCVVKYMSLSPFIDSP
jgi:hypothetical protein